MTGIEILSDISSGPRLQILNSLEENSLKASEIAKKTNSSIQALSRHLEKLVESKLVEKTPEGKYQISTIGKITLSQIPFFEFLSKHKEYFETHDFTGIPEHLVSRIGDLANCKLESDFIKSMQIAREFCINAKNSLYSAAGTVPMELFDILVEKEKGFQWKNVYGTNTVVAKGFSKYPSRKKFIKTSDYNIEEKIVKHIPVNVVVSENGCQFFFANKKLGQVDGKGAFFGNDEKSIQWCKELVDYYWNLPEVENFKLKEQ